MSFLGLYFNIAGELQAIRVPNDRFPPMPFGTSARSGGRGGVRQVEEGPSVSVANVTNHTSAKFEVSGQLARFHFGADEIAQHAAEIFVAWE